ncbi:MAG TPA: hypothetical protein VFB16_05910 [Bauldia sp.]|nr:hypothetical protein [Bauldia sp.]
MRRFAISILAALLVATAAEAAPLKGTDVFYPGSGVNAQTGKPKPGGSIQVTPAGGTYAPLTAQECKTLGGSVISASVCNSGSSCQRVDQNGTVHEVCLSK